jgi:hypothetical protein
MGDDSDARAATEDATVPADAGDASEHAIETSSSALAPRVAEAAAEVVSDSSAEGAADRPTEGAAESPSETSADGAAETSGVVDGTLWGFDANLEPETASTVQDEIESGADSGSSPGPDGSDTDLQRVHGLPGELLQRAIARRGLVRYRCRRRS